MLVSSGVPCSLGDDDGERSSNMCLRVEELVQSLMYLCCCAGEVLRLRV